MEIQDHHHSCYCLLDANYSSELLCSKIADIPQKLKYETILAPIFEYCLGTSDQDQVWEEEFTEDKHYSDNASMISLKIDWIRDETFLYNQIFNLPPGKVNILARKLELLNNRKFLLASRYGGIYDFDNLSEELRNDRELIMEIVKEKGLNLKYASSQLRNDKDIVKEAVRRNGIALMFASGEIQDDKEIVMIALESGGGKGYPYEYASGRLKDDNDIIIKNILNYPQYAHNYQKEKLYEIFNNDRELILKIPRVSLYPTLEYASYELRNDKEFVLKLIQQNPETFQSASYELKNDREFVKESVEKNGTCLGYASKEYNDDREIVELALKSCPDVIDDISDRLRNDTEFILKAIGKRGFQKLPEEFANDREIVLESTKRSFSTLRSASDELKNDREFILSVVKHCGRAFLFICNNLKFRYDREIVMEVVSQDNSMLGFFLNADPLYGDDEEIIIKAAQSHGQSQTPSTRGDTRAYFYDKLSDRLKNDRELFKKCGCFFNSFPRKYQTDREIVMECVKTNPADVMLYAFPLIATERVLAMRIVKRNGLLLKDLPSKYRADRLVVSFAIQQNKKAFQFASAELQNASEILNLYNNDL